MPPPRKVSPLEHTVDLANKAVHRANELLTPLTTVPPSTGGLEGLIIGLQLSLVACLKNMHRLWPE
jgi:hypothetical protein